MDFIIEDGYQVKWGMHEEYQQWVSANTDALRRALPDGIEYIGTYVTVYGNDYIGGTFRDLFRIDSYGALDRMAAEQRRPGSDLSRLNGEASRFIDTTRGLITGPQPVQEPRRRDDRDIKPSEAKEPVGAGPDRSAGGRTRLNERQRSSSRVLSAVRASLSPLRARSNAPGIRSSTAVAFSASESASSRALVRSDRARVPGLICVRSASRRSFAACSATRTTVTRLDPAAMSRTSARHGSCGQLARAGRAAGRPASASDTRRGTRAARRARRRSDRRTAPRRRSAQAPRRSRPAAR